MQAPRPVDPMSAPIADVAPKRQDSEAESDLKYCKELMSQGKAARSEVDGDWQKRLDYYLGKQWGGSGKSQTYGSKPVMNIIRQTIQAVLPILTDQRPGFAVLPKEPTDFDFANMMSELISSYWDNYSMDHTLLEVLMDEMQLDAGIMKVTWDSSLENGAGDIKVETVSPFDIYVPYDAVDFTKSCPWVIQRSTKTVASLKEMFPDFKDKIKADQSTDKDSKANVKSEDIKLVSPTDQYSPPGMGGSNGNSEDLRKTAEVWEIWSDDTTYEDVLDEATGNTVTKKKYPQGCIITILPNQNLRLQKVANPYAHGRWPYVRFVDHIMPRSFWGEGESKVLMQTQRALNKTLKNIFDYLNLMSNPTWVIDEDSGVDPDSITNQIAQVITTRSGGLDKIKRDVVPAIQPGTFDLYSLMVRQSEMISGMSEVSQGRKPPDVSSGVAIESLQEAAQTRIRLKERNMQVALQQLGYQMVCLMCQYYTEPRVSRITGKDQAWPRYFEFFVEAGSKPGSYKLNKKEYATTDGQTYVAEPNYTTTQETKGPMDIRVMSGTAMPWSKASRANIAFRLYDAKAIGIKDLLDALEWPNADKVSAAMEAQVPPEGAMPPGGAEGQPPPMPTAGQG